MRIIKQCDLLEHEQVLRLELKFVCVLVNHSVLVCLVLSNKHLMIGAPASHVCFVLYKSEVCVYHRPTQVQLMRGEFLETALYWAEVVPVHFGAIAEKKVNQHFCVRVSVWVRQPVHEWLHMVVRTCINKCVHVLIHRVVQWPSFRNGFNLT